MHFHFFLKVRDLKMHFPAFFFEMVRDQKMHFTRIFFEMVRDQKMHFTRIFLKSFFNESRSLRIFAFVCVSR